MPTFTFIDLINTAVGLMSLVLGGFALWLSWDIYGRAKDAEKATAITIEAIKTQTDSLQRLNGRLLDRLTRYATEPRPVDASMQMLVTTVANLPLTLLTHLGGQSSNTLNDQASGTASNDAEIADLVSCYIMLYYYCGLANVAAQSSLPSQDAFMSNPAEYAGVKRLVDMSANDFGYMKNIVDKVHSTRLEASRYYQFYTEAENDLVGLVHDTDAHFTAA